MQIFLNKPGLRVIFGKTQGLLYKFANADCFLSRLTPGWFVLGRLILIKRPRSKGREGRWRNTDGAELRGGGLAGDAQSVVPVAGLDRGLALE